MLSAMALNADFDRELCKRLLNFVGIVNYSKMNLKIIDKKMDSFIIRCNLEMLSELIVALSIIKDPNLGKAFYTIKSSGTISGLKRNISD